jgi:hypothetical protein
MDYGDWERKNSERKDPTLIGVGYKSRAIIGKHPDGVLVVDDICDENNTSSLRELEGMHNKLQANIIPTIEPTTKVMFIGTPWTEGDALAYMKATGELIAMKTPVMQDGELTWPEKYDEDEIRKQQNLAGEIEFARMFMLDLEAAKGHILKREWIKYYPATEIKPDWSRFIGLDYASVSDKSRRTFKDRDYCAIIVGCVTPARTLILEDGFFGRISQAEAEQRLIAMASSLPTLQQIGIEAIGKGEEFYNLMMSASTFLPIMPIPSHTGEARSKGGRFEKVLAKLFQRGSILLSDRITPFLQEFNRQWIAWDGTGVSHDDLLDACYMLTKAADGYIAVPELQATPRSPLYEPKAKQPNPWVVR